MGARGGRGVGARRDARRRAWRGRVAARGELGAHGDAASGRGSVGRVFRCPHCGAPLETGERAWRCANGHSFDVARQGYVALERKAARGDTAEMVAARVAFLEAGHYAPIVEALVAAVAAGGEGAGGGKGAAGAGGGGGGGGGEGAAGREGPGDGEGAAGARTVVDLGAGPGYYLAAVLDAQPGARGVALDSSRPALRRAARAHPRITAVACDAWDALPLQDGIADVVLNVFAPRNPGEMRRVLKPEGRIVVVTPTERHLKELDLLRVHPEKRERLHHDLGSPQQERDLEFTLELDDVTPLVQMGPSAHHGLERQGRTAGDGVRHRLDVQGLSVPSKLPDPHVSGSLKPSAERVGRVDDELVEPGDPRPAGDRRHDRVERADLRAPSHAARRSGCRSRSPRRTPRPSSHARPGPRSGPRSPCPWANGRAAPARRSWRGARRRPLAAPRRRRRTRGS